MNIKIIYDSRNYTIIRDNVTNYIWLYSYREPIAYFDGLFHFANNDNILTRGDKFHFSNFKKFFENSIDK